MGCIPLQKGRRSVWAQRLVVRIVVYAHIPRRRGEGRGGVGVRVHSGYRKARVAFGVQAGGQHREESVAGRNCIIHNILDYLLSTLFTPSFKSSW
jgi:hypothetical protein